jgi:hypothetical protein
MTKNIWTIDHFIGTAGMKILGGKSHENPNATESGHYHVVKSHLFIAGEGASDSRAL